MVRTAILALSMRAIPLAAAYIAHGGWAGVIRTWMQNLN